MLSDTAKVSIVVPTLNRSDFVLRLLDYYRDNGFAGRLLIGDSSEPAHFEAVGKRIAELAPALDAVHVDCIGLGPTAAMLRLNSMIETPYATYSGDDDYIVPTAIAECVAFLEANPDYVAAQGRGRAFELDRAGASGQIRFTGPYPMRGFERESAGSRLAWHLHAYTVTIFGIHRTPVWQKMWNAGADIPDRAFSAELLPVCLSVIYGRMKLIGTLYLLRQGHPGTYHLADPLDWFATPAWGPSYRKFAETLSSEIVRIDGMDKKAAEFLVRSLFHEYLFTDSSTLRYKIGLMRMNAVTRLIPYYVEIDRRLPSPVSRVVRAVAARAFDLPFATARWMAEAPTNAWHWMAGRRAAVTDRTSLNSMAARQAAKRSASIDGQHSDA